MKHSHRKSDRPVVPKKPSNKVDAGVSAAERVEGRGLAKGNPQEQNSSRAQAPERADTCAGEDTQSSKPSLWRHYLRQEPGAVIPPAGICAGGAGQPAASSSRTKFRQFRRIPPTSDKHRQTPPLLCWSEFL
jgi:hypothetical protein